MLDFKPLDFDAKKIYDAYEKAYGYVNMEHNFAVMHVWRERMDIRYCLVDDALVLMTHSPDFPPMLVQPMHFDLDAPIMPLFDRVLEYCAKKGIGFSLRGVTPAYAARILEARDDIECLEDANNYEYVYLSEDLIHLRGKKFSQKRNHINNFLKEHEFRYVPFAPEHYETVQFLNFKWGFNHGLDEDYEHETLAIERTMNDYDKLNMRGCLIEVDGEYAAFSFGVPAGQEMFTVLFEKAKPDIPGLYQIINREFAAHEGAGYKYINRQEDLGLPGLRHAKRSYNPVFLIEKRELRLKGQ